MHRAAHHHPHAGGWRSGSQHRAGAGAGQALEQLPARRQYSGSALLQEPVVGTGTHLAGQKRKGRERREGGAPRCLAAPHLAPQAAWLGAVGAEVIAGSEGGAPDSRSATAADTARRSRRPALLRPPEHDMCMPWGKHLCPARAGARVLLWLRVGAAGKLKQLRQRVAQLSPPRRPPAFLPAVVHAGHCRQLCPARNLLGHVCKRSCPSVGVLCPTFAGGPLHGITLFLAGRALWYRHS